MEVPDNSETMPWVEKYRPQKLEEILAHEEVLRTINNLIDQNRMPHLLLYGPPGTGKTTTILACARKLYGPNYHNFVLELNASDERGISVVRNQIKDFASTRQIFSNISFKMIILDEADQMTNEAQAALRRVIEKFTSNVRFCLLCNYVNRVIPALQSRCTRFRLPPLKKSQVIERLRFIVGNEKAPFDEDGLKAVYKLSNGDMRKCLNIMQSTLTSCKVINEEAVYRTTGHPSTAVVRELVSSMVNGTFNDALDKVNQLKFDKGLAITDVLGELLPFLTRLELPEDVKRFLFKAIADIEYNMSISSDDKLSTMSLVGSFQLARIAASKGIPIASLIPNGWFDNS